MITRTKIKLRDKRLADAADNYAWGTDPELAELDAAALLTSVFDEYLAGYACVYKAQLSYAAVQSTTPPEWKATSPLWHLPASTFRILILQEV